MSSTTHPPLPEREPDSSIPHSGRPPASLNIPLRTRPPTPDPPTHAQITNLRNINNNLRQHIDNLTQIQETLSATPSPNDPYLRTSRAHNPPTDIVPRTLIKLHHPINLKALALVRSGVGHNLISALLIQQLRIRPYATDLTEEDPEFGTPARVHGAVELRVAVKDDGGEEREGVVRFLVVDMYEDVVLGVEWMCMARVVVGFSARVFRWYRKEEEDDDGGEDGGEDGDEDGGEDGGADGGADGGEDGGEN